MDDLRVPVARSNQELPLPAFAYEGDAGMDLRSSGDVLLAAGTWAAIPTGLKIALPDGCVGWICPRSGLAVEHGVTVLNGPGCVDSSYRGELMVLLVNLSHQDFVVRVGERVAQLVIQEMKRWVWEEKPSLSPSDRGEEGFGSSGI